MIEQFLDLLPYLFTLLPIVGISGQQASGSGSGSSFQEGASRGLAESESQFGSEALSSSRGTSQSQSLGESVSGGTSSSSSLGESVSGGTSTSTGFGFSGLAPEQSAVLGRAVQPSIATTIPNLLSDISTARINLPTLTSIGLFPQQEEAARELVRQSTAILSGRAAGQGQQSPYNIPSIAGSAVTQALPSLLPTISQNVLAAAQAPLTEAGQRAAATQTAIAGLPGLLGGQQQSSSLADQFSRALQRSESASEQFARSLQSAQALANQVSDSISQSFGSSFSKSVTEAFSKAMSDFANRSSSFGFGLGR